METAHRPLLPGILLVVLGLLFLFSNLADVNIGMLWPLVMLGPGIYFFVLYFMNRTNFGVLMPASVLTMMGGLFLYCEITGWRGMHELWPLFLLGPGVGFLLMYFFGKREIGFLLPGSILVALGLLFLFQLHESDIFWPALMILAGLLLLLGRSSRPSVTTAAEDTRPRP